MVNNPARWIAGLMRQNYEAVGFIPDTTVQERYIKHGRYVLQSDNRGRAVGYLLHGPIHYGQPCAISQHCIEYDKRLLGFGQMAVRTLVERARNGGASVIRLRVAQDLAAVQFWQSCGFSAVRIVPGGKKRERMILIMALDCSPMKVAPAV